MYTWNAAQNEDDPDHVHPYNTALVILEGEISVTLGGKIFLLNSGDRFNILKSTLHSAIVGIDGCKYVVAEDNG